jgi:hypothetical protein
MGMKTIDINASVSFKTLVEEARNAVPSKAMANVMQRAAGLAYIEAQQLIQKKGQKAETYAEAAKIINVAIVAISQQLEKAKAIYKAKTKAHRNTRDIREAVMVGEQVNILLDSYLHQLEALVESASPGDGNIVKESINQWINKINANFGDSHMIVSDKDWNAIYEGSSTALQFVSLDGYIYRYVKAATALKKMLVAAKTDEALVDNAADLTRLMERCQLAYADVVNARKTLIAKNKENKAE